ncbi:unnamed protein product [Adineta ricciae]|uniref:Uncharacterized protein n=1 Tax=Adineta ricciae TaxID=249248 RepID=A0A815YEU5_ADIRI|nr:unnamed protein product [Adineta ricciae]CAF1569583.1 unnamed protein product [Adineta ricciae]
MNPARINYENFQMSDSIFVSNNSDIYMSSNIGRVDKWTANAKHMAHLMTVEETCVDLFVDMDNNLYCSMFQYHVVTKRFSNDEHEQDITVLAGKYNSGWKPDCLDGPRGIFVDINFDLYVADYNNQRIQLFHPRKLNGQTVAGQGSSDITTILYGPVAVVLDAEKHLFIVDYETKRILGSGPNGFQCLVGCHEKIIDPNQFDCFASFSFDVHGNTFVPLKDTLRIQIFHLQNDSCDASSNVQAQYSSILPANYTTFSRVTLNHSKYHYEVIVNKKAFYVLIGNSSVDLYGHVYKDHFDQFNLTNNLIVWYGKYCNRNQFKFTLELFLNTKYILVVTMYNSNVTSPFSITVFGSNTVQLQCTSE